MEDKIAGVNAIKGSEDLGAIKTATDELSSTVQKIGQAMYQGQETPPPIGEGAQEASKEDAKETTASEEK